MREILFRGKVIESTVKEVGEWVYGHLVVRKDHDDGPEQCFICEEGHKFIRCLNKMPCTYKVDPETVGQYTGLKDKNGKKIFEGDIIRVKIGSGNYDSFEWPKMQVGFRDGAFCLIDAVGRMLANFNGFAPSVVFEIIGNIHDNPEALGSFEA